MTTSQIPSMLYEIEAGLPIPLEKRAYFHARVLNSFYQFVLCKFLEEEQSGRITKAELARRIGKRPEIVSRLLGAPGNWGLETATDLLLGICGEELQPCSSPLLNRAPRNYDHCDWLIPPIPSPVTRRPQAPTSEMTQNILQMIEKAKTKGAPVPVV